MVFGLDLGFQADLVEFKLDMVIDIDDRIESALQEKLHEHEIFNEDTHVALIILDRVVSLGLHRIRILLGAAAAHLSLGRTEGRKHALLKVGQIVFGIDRFAFCAHHDDVGPFVGDQHAVHGHFFDFRPGIGDFFVCRLHTDF